MLQAERWRGSPGAHGAKPATGATVQIAASKKVAFRAAKELKAAV
jgi:nucleoid DNA-binding protein